MVSMSKASNKKKKKRDANLSYWMDDTVCGVPWWSVVNWFVTLCAALWAVSCFSPRTSDVWNCVSPIKEDFADWSGFGTVTPLWTALKACWVSCFSPPASDERSCISPIREDLADWSGFRTVIPLWTALKACWVYQFTLGSFSSSSL